MFNKHISIHYKILMSFIIVTLLTLPISLYTITATNKIKRDFTNIIDDSIPRLQSLLEMQLAARRITAFINNLDNEIAGMTINENTPTKIGAAKDKMLAYLGEIEEWQRVYQENISPSEGSILDLNKLTELRDKVVLGALESFSAKEKNLSPQDQTLAQEKLGLAQKNLEQFIKVSLSTESDILAKKKKNALNSTKRILMVTLFLNGLILLIAIVMSLVLTGIISRPIIRLKNFASSINQDNLDKRFPIETRDEIGALAKTFNTMLENLLKAKEQLLEASRAAGVAEVATSILHNVGNVLNSINTSTSVMNEAVHHSKIKDLKKVYELLEKHQDTLPAFFQSEQGQLILPYLEKLSHQLTVENQALKEELQRLSSNLQHVNHVIAMQQSYGRSKGLVESFSLKDLIETTYQISANTIQKAGIEVKCDIEDLPPIYTVKAKLQQILINLIKNAIEALVLSQNPNKKLNIKAIRINNKLQILVIDNGIGIKNENLNKIFSFGFTTKDNGHGYGVHNSALLAKELGGHLFATSAGIEKGATFELEIPFEQK